MIEIIIYRLAKPNYNFPFGEGAFQYGHAYVLEDIKQKYLDVDTYPNYFNDNKINHIENIYSYYWGFSDYKQVRLWFDYNHLKIMEKSNGVKLFVIKSTRYHEATNQMIFHRDHSKVVEINSPLDIYKDATYLRNVA